MAKCFEYQALKVPFSKTCSLVMIEASQLCEPILPMFVIEPCLTTAYHHLVRYLAGLQSSKQAGQVDIDLDVRNGMIRIRKPYSSCGDYARVKIIDDEK